MLKSWCFGDLLMCFIVRPGRQLFIVTSSDLLKCTLFFNPENNRNQLQISIEFLTRVLHDSGTLSEINSQLSIVVRDGSSTSTEGRKICPNSPARTLSAWLKSHNWCGEFLA